jgi:Zn-dependent peptidase ImmA (M78 family)
MKNLLFLIFSIIISGCATGYQVDELIVYGFEDYITKFENDSIIYGRPTKIQELVIQFGDLRGYREEKNVVGLCQRAYNFQPPIITIDLNYWQQITDAEKEWLVYHELGHCILNREHREDRIRENNCVASVMYPKTEYACYENLQDYYLKELFTVP